MATIFGDNASAQRSIPLAADAGGFFLQQRALHVFAEAERVLKFQDVCNSSDLGQEEKLQRLGQLMDESQTSCRWASLRLQQVLLGPLMVGDPDSCKLGRQGLDLM